MPRQMASTACSAQPGLACCPPDAPEEDGAGKHLHRKPEVCIGGKLPAPLRLLQQ